MEELIYNKIKNLYYVSMTNQHGGIHHMTKKTIVDVIKYTLPVKSRVALVIAFTLSLLSAAIGLISPLIVKEFVDQFSNQVLDWTLIALVVGLLITDSVSSTVASSIIKFTEQKVVYLLREILWSKILKLPVSYFQKNKSESLVSRLTEDATLISSILTKDLIDFVMAIISVIGAIIVLMFTDFWLTILVIVLVPLTFVLVIPLFKRIELIHYTRQEKLSEVTVFSSQILRNFKIVKAYGREEDEQAKGKNFFSSMYQLSIKEAIIDSVIYPLLSVIGFVIVVIVVGFGFWRLGSGDLTMGTLVAFVLYLFQVIVHVAGIGMNIGSYHEAKGSLKQVFGILMEKEEESKTAKDSKMEFPFNEIKLENVHFSYDKKENVIANLSLHVCRGEVLALIGESGAGKSTIINLLERFYEPDSGNMLIDNISYKNIPPQIWRKGFSLVSQDTSLFDGTIKDNIKYANPNATDDEVIFAAKQASAHEFIMKLEEGYDSDIGDYGSYLSGGQKQRIAIARAFLRKSSFVLLDEYTSNVDSDTEQELIKAVSQLRGDMGFIIIAHRLSTVKGADKIAVMKDGQLEDIGTHEELIKRNDYYVRVIREQMDRG
ncbi:ABC transporter ATP-binding protein [Bacillus vallismortis]|uniref:ABC transporter ATP-binding protein n=1 Tax=Bacillus vallismortis TaxID=72361 RepID=UPI000287D8DC|nr:ABC transporter ATP-binding protein [Bacillus vallismortis]MEC1270372.1 ABC transporter ATP-binding protein [Bacillus vallismortis]QAV09650.1 ABC transporter ATP-binding protein [Bacillus vallismortis]